MGFSWFVGWASARELWSPWGSLQLAMKQIGGSWLGIRWVKAVAWLLWKFDKGGGSRLQVRVEIETDGKKRMWIETLAMDLGSEERAIGGRKVCEELNAGRRSSDGASEGFVWLGFKGVEEQRSMLCEGFLGSDVNGAACIVFQQHFCSILRDLERISAAARGEGRGLCSSGCGFYGSDATLGLCSKCYRDHIFSSHINKTAQQLASIVGSGNKNGHIGSKGSASVTESKNKTKQRCSKCDRKVGLAMGAIKCRCNGVFCAAHRLPEDHGCTFDYRTAGRLLLEDANPLIKAEKLNTMQ